MPGQVVQWRRTARRAFSHGRDVDTGKPVHDERRRHGLGHVCGRLATARPTAKVAVATIVPYIKIARIHPGRPAERNVLTAGRPASIGRGFTLGGWPGGLSEALVRFDVALAGG